MTNLIIDRPESGRQETEGPVRSLVRNLAAGLRLAFFLRLQPDSFRPNLNQAMLLSVLALVFLLLMRFCMVLPNPQFSAAGLGPIAANYIAFLLGVWLICALARDSGLFLPFMVMLTSAQPALTTVLAMAVAAVAATMDGYGWVAGMWAVFGLSVFWQMLIGLRAIRLLTELRIRRSLFTAAVYLAAITLPSFAMPQIPVWYKGYDAEGVADATPPEPIDVERTFYVQPAMVESGLDRIERGRPGVADLYFLGFASYGSQDVFMKEVRLANNLFDQRFDTAGRSLALVNNRQTIDSLPLANVSNLRLALNGLAERMDRDEDILFLFLTSHGSKDYLATDFWPLQHNDLSAAELRAMLDEAGVGWRVIVVSACYSGSFIDELRSDRTLIITASREDRNSFGCSNEAEMTYFGRALIDEALRSTRSFISAYALAAKQIASQEEAEGLTPSEPQISIGGKITTKLEELTARLDRLGDVAAR